MALSVFFGYGNVTVALAFLMLVFQVLLPN